MDPIHGSVSIFSVISRLLAGGSLGFRIVLLLLPGLQISVWHCCGLVVRLFAEPLPHQSLGDTMLSSFSYIADAYELISWSPAVLFFGFCFVFFFVWFFGVFCFVVVFAVCFLSYTVTAQWTMYRSNSVHWSNSVNFAKCNCWWREPSGVGWKN